MKEKYLVKNGINYGEKRAEAGDVVDDIPAESVEWLLEQGHIERTSAEGEEEN